MIDTYGIEKDVFDLISPESSMFVWDSFPGPVEYSVDSRPFNEIISDLPESSILIISNDAVKVSGQVDVIRDVIRGPIRDKFYEYVIDSGFDLRTMTTPSGRMKDMIVPSCEESLRRRLQGKGQFNIVSREPRKYDALREQEIKRSLLPQIILKARLWEKVVIEKVEEFDLRTLTKKLDDDDLDEREGDFGVDEREGEDFGVDGEEYEIDLRKHKSDGVVGVVRGEERRGDRGRLARGEDRGELDRGDRGRLETRRLETRRGGERGEDRGDIYRFSDQSLIPISGLRNLAEKCGLTLSELAERINFIAELEPSESMMTLNVGILSGWFRKLWEEETKEVFIGRSVEAIMDSISLEGFLDGVRVETNLSPIEWYLQWWIEIFTETKLVDGKVRSFCRERKYKHNAVRNLIKVFKNGPVWDTYDYNYDRDKFREIVMKVSSKLTNNKMDYDAGLLIAEPGKYPLVKVGDRCILWM